MMASALNLCDNAGKREERRSYRLCTSELASHKPPALLRNRTRFKLQIEG